jgi:hypothetical protein
MGLSAGSTYIQFQWTVFGRKTNGNESLAALVILLTQQVSLRILYEVHYSLSRGFKISQIYVLCLKSLHLPIVQW